MQSEIIISIDIDWAPEEVIKDTLDLLDKFDANATIFMTNPISINIGKHETAIHPHYTSFDFEKHLLERILDFPAAIGTRSHTLFDTYGLQAIYKKHGIKYQSNVMMLLQNNIKPYRITKNVLEIPIFWMDIPYMEIFDDTPSFRLNDLNLENPGLKVFDFHPIHVFLNTKSISQYNEAKKYYKNPDELLKYRNTKTPGIRDLFIELLGYLKDKNIRTKTLKDIYHIYTDEAGN